MNVFAYRRPGKPASIFRCGNSSEYSFLPGNEGLVVAPFDSASNPLFYPYEDSLAEIPDETVTLNQVDFPFHEMSRREYDAYIAVIQSALQGDEGSKIVASRRESLSCNLAASRIFSLLCGAYPSATVFYISTSDFGSWIGATPELLLQRQGDTLSSMSLAGTRTAGSSGSWDTKNLMEQRIVTDYLVSVMRQAGLIPEIGICQTVAAGPVEHLMTPVSARIKDDTSLKSLLGHLAPTPALSGFPKKEAMSIIKDMEGSRALYGGYFGPVESSGDFGFNVILRCAMLRPGSAVLFAGGGVTVHSNAAEEWLETERKLSTLVSILT